MSKISYILMLSVFVLLACGNRSMLAKLKTIEKEGNKNPKLAIRMLDSLELQTREHSEYIQMKYDLLRIRLDDMAGNAPVSDIKAKRAAEYFEKNGSKMEYQKACYYAGSVYRDLHDTPRALEYFSKSTDVARESGKYDTAMLRNSYSNLHYLYYNVQDYNKALSMAKTELALSEEINDIQATTIMHLGNSYLALDSLTKAKKCFDQILSIIKATRNCNKNDLLYVLLYNYSFMHAKKEANECYDILRAHDYKMAKQPDFNAIGAYFDFGGNTESAIWCYKKTIETNRNDFDKYDAVKALFRIYQQAGEQASANIYASKFVDLSEKLDLGRRQELAATVSNEFQYHLDRNKLERTEQWNSFFRRIAIGASLLMVVLSLSFYVFYMKRRNDALKKLLKLANELDNAKQQKESIKNEMEAKAVQLEQLRNNLKENQDALLNVNAELDKYTNELHDAKQKLAEKTRQSQSLLQILHKTELEAKAEDVLIHVKEAANGKHKLGAEEWKQLFTAVDKLHPTFKEKVIERSGVLTEQQMQVIYLMKIGFTNPQIKNVTDIPRTTIWRWANSYKWIEE